MRSHLRICGKLKCESCGKIYKGTQGLERHLSIKKGFHRASNEAEEILRHIRRKPQRARHPPRHPTERFLLPKVPVSVRTTSASTQTERVDQGTQVEIYTDVEEDLYTSHCNNNPTLKSDSACSSQMHQTDMWEETRNSFACQTYFDQPCLFSDSVPVQTDSVEYYDQNDTKFTLPLTTATTSTDMNCQTDSFSFFELESAGTQTDFIFDDILKDVFTETDSSIAHGAYDS